MRIWEIPVYQHSSRTTNKSLREADVIKNGDDDQQNEWQSQAMIISQYVLVPSHFQELGTRTGDIPARRPSPASHCDSCTLSTSSAWRSGVGAEIFFKQGNPRIKWNFPAGYEFLITHFWFGTSIILGIYALCSPSTLTTVQILIK